MIDERFDGAEGVVADSGHGETVGQRRSDLYAEGLVVLDGHLHAWTFLCLDALAEHVRHIMVNQVP